MSRDIYIPVKLAMPLLSQFLYPSHQVATFGRELTRYRYTCKNYQATLVGSSYRLRASYAKFLMRTVNRTTSHDNVLFTSEYRISALRASLTSNEK